MGSQIKKIFIIQLIDSLCVGLLLPVLNNYIHVGLQGTHTTTGFLTSLQLLVHTCSCPVLINTRNEIGNKNVLMMTTCLMLLFNLILTFPQKTNVIIIIRCFYSFSNHTSDILREMVSREIKKEELENINYKLECLSFAGLIIGPIIGANVYFYYNYCFTCVVKLMVLLNTTNIVICYLIKDPEPINLDNKSKISSLKIFMKDKYNSTILDLNCFKPDQHLIFISIKLLTLISLTTFFLKFTLLLRDKFNANVLLVGYTVAYQNAMLFLSKYVVLYSHQYTKRVKLSLIISLTVLLLLMVKLMMIDTYEGYLIIYIPLITTISILDKLWEQIYMTEKNMKLVKVLIVGFEILLPVVFSIICDHYDFQALKLASTVPLAIALFLSMLYDQEKLKSE